MATRPAHLTPLFPPVGFRLARWQSAVLIVELAVGAFMLFSLAYLFYPSTLPGSGSFDVKLYGLRTQGEFLLAYFVARGMPLSVGQVHRLLGIFFATAAVIAGVAILEFAAP